MEATYKLSALVDDLLLRFADDVDVDEFTYLDGHSVRCASLVLKISLGDGEDLSIAVESHSYDKKDKIDLGENIVSHKHVNLNCRDETHLYHMKNLGEVLRYDSNSDESGVADHLVNASCAVTASFCLASLGVYLAGYYWDERERRARKAEKAFETEPVLMIN